MTLSLTRQLRYSWSHLSPCLIRSLCTQATPKVPEDVFNNVTENLVRTVNAFRTSPIKPQMYSPDIVLQDDIQKVTIKGLPAYQFYIMKYTMYINWKYNGFNIKAIDVQSNPDDAVVTIKWIFYGKPGWYLTFFLDLAKLVSRSQEELKDRWDAIEGLSIYHLNPTGYVDKHVLKIIRKGTYGELVRGRHDADPNSSDSNSTSKA